MKKIVVEVSDEQEDYIAAIARNFPRISKSDLVLALAMSQLCDGCEEGRVESLLAAVQGYVIDRGIPNRAAADFFEYGHSLRPAGAHFADVVQAAAEKAPVWRKRATDAN